MASPDEKRYPTNYANLVGVVVFIWISFFVVVVQALHDDTRVETATVMIERGKSKPRVILNRLEDSTEYTVQQEPTNLTENPSSSDPSADEPVSMAEEQNQPNDVNQSGDTPLNMDTSEFLQVLNRSGELNFRRSTGTDYNMILLVVNIAASNNRSTPTQVASPSTQDVGRTPEMLTEANDSNGNVIDSTDSVHVAEPIENSNNHEPVPMTSSSDAQKQSNPTTPANRMEWFPYRPRTRSAKRKISFSDIIVISSDSEDWDADDTIHEPRVALIVPKKEILDSVKLEVKEQTNNELSVVHVSRLVYAPQENDSNGNQGNDSTEEVSELTQVSEPAGNTPVTSEVINETISQVYEKSLPGPLNRKRLEFECESNDADSEPAGNTPVTSEVIDETISQVYEKSLPLASESNVDDSTLVFNSADNDSFDVDIDDSKPECLQLDNDTSGGTLPAKSLPFESNSNNEEPVEANTVPDSVVSEEQQESVRTEDFSAVHSECGRLEYISDQSFPGTLSLNDENDHEINSVDSNDSVYRPSDGNSLQGGENAKELDDPLVANTNEPSAIEGVPNDGTADAGIAAAPREEVVFAACNTTYSLGNLSGQMKMKPFCGQRWTSDDELVINDGYAARVMCGECEDPSVTSQSSAFPRNTSPADLVSETIEMQVGLELPKDDESIDDHADPTDTIDDEQLVTGTNENGYISSSEHYPQQNDESPARMMRKRKNDHSIDPSVIPEKRALLGEYSSDSTASDQRSSSTASDQRSSSSSDDEYGRPSASSWRMQDNPPPHTVIGKIGGFLKKYSQKLEKKLKSQFSRKGTRSANARRTSAGNFSITTIRKRKPISSVNGFRVLPVKEEDSP